MGVSGFSNSCCGCDKKIKKLNGLPNPDPKNFNIKEYKSFGCYIVVRINYPDCINYEGDKILVFENTSVDRLQQLDFIDPHFCTEKHLSPIARFEPTKRGWDMSCKFAKNINNG